MPSVSWLPWSVDAFARARAERKPVLLSIGTGWSHACRAMDAESYGDPAEAAPCATGPVARAAAVDEAELTAMVFASFDAEHGGFGSAPKFPLVAPIRLALRLHRDQPDDRLAHIASASLDAMGWGPLHDDT